MNLSHLSETFINEENVNEAIVQDIRRLKLVEKDLQRNLNKIKKIPKNSIQITIERISRMFSIPLDDEDKLIQAVQSLVLEVDSTERYIEILRDNIGKQINEGENTLLKSGNGDRQKVIDRLNQNKLQLSVSQQLYNQINLEYKELQQKKINLLHDETKLDLQLTNMMATTRDDYLKLSGETIDSINHLADLININFDDATRANVEHVFNETKYLWDRLSKAKVDREASTRNVQQELINIRERIQEKLHKAKCIKQEIHYSKTKLKDVSSMPVYVQPPDDCQLFPEVRKMREKEKRSYDKINRYLGISGSINQKTGLDDIVTLQRRELMHMTSRIKMYQDEIYFHRFLNKYHNHNAEIDDITNYTDHLSQFNDEVLNSV